MSSGGQIVGAVVGGVTGFVVGGPTGALKGAAYGASIGAALDPPPGPDIEGPRIDDNAEQSSSYGAPVSTVNGKIGVKGTIIWVEHNKKKIVAKKEDSGGGKGGGGGSETTTYEAFVTCAILLADHEVDGVGRLWFGSNLVSNGLTNDLATAAASNELFPTLSLHTDSGLLKASLATNPNSGTVRLYPGYDDQPADPRMEADLGAGNCPAYRGYTLLFLYDYPLKGYSSSIAGLQVRAELIKSGVGSSPTLVSYIATPNLDKNRYGNCYYLNQEEAVVHEADNVSPYYNRRIEFSQTGSTGSSSAFTDDTSFDMANGWTDEDIGTIPKRPPWWEDNYPHNWTNTVGYIIYKNGLYYGQRSAFGLDWIYFQNTERKACAADPAAICVDDSGFLYLLHGTNSYGPSAGITKYDAVGNLVEFKNITFVGENIDGGRSVRMAWDSANDLIYVGFGGGNNTTSHFYAVDFEAGIKSDMMDCPSPVERGLATRENIATNKFTVEGNILTRFVHLDWPGSPEPTDPEWSLVIERWQLPAVDGSGESLASVTRARLERSELIEPADIDVTLLTGNVTGYATSGISSVRSTVSPLMSAYNYDIQPHGYQLRAVPRGQSSVMTIDYDDLDARPFGSAPGIAVDHQREMDAQLPKQLLVDYIDAGRNYNRNQESSIERIGSTSVNKESYEVPFVFTPDEAATLASVQMDRRWLERDDFAFVLPQTYNRLEAADVVDIETPYATYEWLLTSANLLTDGRVECTAKLNDSVIYTQNATGGTRVVGDTTISFAGKSVMHLLDIPLIRDEDNKAGFAGSLCGKSSGWPGGTIIRSVDSGQTFQPIQGFSSGVTSGICSDSLPAHDGYVIDRENTLTINLYNSSMSLSSITEAQMLTGKHWAAYGVAGRWELIQFANATLNADDTYTLDTFIRGAKGTEQYTDDHVDGDIFILLADADAAFIAANVSDIGQERIYRGVTAGKDIDAVSNTLFTYSGVNLKPLSPVQIAGSIDGSNNWDITWKRRSRLTSSEWATGVAIPIGETLESYEIDIMNGSTVVRTLTATSEAVEYSSADQITDFGGNQSTITIKIYQMSSVVGRGYVSEATL